MHEYFQKTFFPPNWKNILLFLFLWLLIGFAVGTGLLLGPIQEITNTLRAGGWSENTEDFIVLAIIILYVLATFFAALFFTRLCTHTNYRHVSWGIITIWLLLTSGSLYLWFSPDLVAPGEESLSSANSRFTFGSYPSAEDIKTLEEQGYTTVISLLHPAVVPFEPELIRRERNAIQESGLEFIHLPMLPWVSDNITSLDSLRTIVNQGTGKYYVHCYLGKDRIGMARRIIESAGGLQAPEQTDSLPKASVNGISMSLERGSVTELENHVYVSPYPTDSEFVSFFFGIPFNNVVSLLNPENNNDIEWIEKEQELLESYEVPFYNFPIPLADFDPDSVLKIARKVKSLEPPVLVHGFLSPSFRSQAFIQAYRSDLPPLPPALFTDILGDGTVRVIAPNLSVGPRPGGPEFGSILARRGIRGFMYLGQADDSTAIMDKSITGTASLNWRSYSPNEMNIEQLLNEFRAGGPWYAYGPGLDQVEDTLSAALGPAVPDSMTYTFSPEKKTSDSHLATFIQSLTPSIKLIILLSPALLIYIFLAAHFAGYLRKFKDIATPYTRKIFHVFIFVMAGILQVLIDVSAVAVFGTLTSLAVLYAVYRGEGFPFYESMARETDRPRRTLFIVIPLITTAVGGLTANILFGPIAYIGYLVTGLGDAVGEPVGKRWGKHTYKVPSLAGVPAKRSIEGSTAVFFTSIFVSLLALSITGTGLTMALGAAFACGMAATLVEAVSNHGLDNFTIQVAATAVVYFLL